MNKLKDEMKKLKEIISIQQEIIGWYEGDHEISTYDEDEFQEDLRNLYKELNKARGRYGIF